MVVQLEVMTLKGEGKIVDLCDSELQLRKMTVLQMTEKIAKLLKIGDNLRIVYRTVPLEDDKLVGSYGIQHTSVVHTVLKLPGGF